MSGLLCARQLRQQGYAVTVVERSQRIGGHVRTIELDGRRVDVGAESLHLGAPAARALIEDLGLSGEVVGAGSSPSWLWTQRGRRVLPAGVGPAGPTRLRPVLRSGVLGIAALARAGLEPIMNELFVADGYGNRRVIVFDATTGAYKRHWGAYGGKPADDKTTYVPGAAPSKQFGTPVHCVRLARDGLVYVCDRTNNRIQVFERSGKYVTEFFLEPNTVQIGAVWDLVLSRDPQQRYLHLADGRNNQILMLLRETGAVVGSAGRPGRYAGEFHWVHDLAVDAQGNLYAGEVDTGKRAQKFQRLR